MSNNSDQFKIKNWLLARFTLSREVAHHQLGMPHYIETDRFVDQRGLEDHWVIRGENDIVIHLVYRAKFESLEAYSDPPDLDSVRNELPNLFASFEFESIDPPELFPTI
jgi:hypothetical protein